MEAGPIRLIQRPTPSLYYWPEGISLGSVRLLEESAEYAMLLYSNRRFDQMTALVSEDIDFPIGLHKSLSLTEPPSKSFSYRLYGSTWRKNALAALVQIAASKGSLKLTRIRKHVAPTQFNERVMELYWTRPKSNGRFAGFFEDVFHVLGHPIVPYCMESRRQRHARAFEELDPYVRRWQALVERKTKRKVD